MSNALHASLRRASVTVLSALFAVALLAGPASLAKEDEVKEDKAEKAEKPKRDKESKVATVAIADEAALLVVLNKADAKTLVRIPGIGEKTAERVIEGRPYEKLDDLKKVKNIADKRLEKIKACIGKTKVPESLFAAEAE